MEPEKKSNGALVGLIIIVVILIIGGVYIWQSKVKNTMPENDQAQTGVTEQDSRELDTLGQDVDNTDANAGVDVNNVK